MEEKNERAEAKGGELPVKQKTVTRSTGVAGARLLEDLAVDQARRDAEGINVRTKLERATIE